MTYVVDWLRRRSPAPPEDLGERLREAVLASADGIGPGGAAGAGGGPGGPVGSADGPQPVAEGLAEAAVEALNRARRAPGRVRASALDLLVADALWTYAAEAAVAEDDPDGTLEDLVRRAAEGGGRRP